MKYVPSLKPRMAVLLMALLGLSHVVNAQTQTVESAIQACSQESNSLQRLVCYDRLAKQLREYSGGKTALPTVSQRPTPRPAQIPAHAQNKVAETPAAVAASPSVVTNSAQDQFGLEHRQDTDAMIQKIYAVVTDITSNAYKKRTITLDNGQRWRQQDGSSLKIAVGDTIYIERGVLGAFYLSTDDLNRRMKVKRAD
ncbi:hypothetical protein [Alteromonas facilis]|uniref:hypothetical protein n=1 Tax=Alteromonas facilis TaxID=2048004 RepID=UPI000C28590B|nr:hypothetical protein [Alteromonas facilis]